MSKLLSLRLGLIYLSYALAELNMIESVRQKEGTNLSTQRRASPIDWVELISLKMNTTIAPIPENTKCMKMVTVCARFSLENIKEVP